jgi:hypothetical protein
MIIDVNTSESGGKSVTAYHPSGVGKATTWVVNGREYNTTYTGKMAHAADCLQALQDWLSANTAK